MKSVHDISHRSATPRRAPLPRFFIAFLGLLVAMTLCVSVVAQNASTGALSGSITDPSGAMIVGAEVTAVNLATGESRGAKSRADGTFVIPLLAPGDYKVSIVAAGFRLASVDTVKVSVTETATIRVPMEVGASNESVTVSGADAMVQTESADMGRVTVGSQIEALPLVSRNFTQIIALNAGVSAEVTNGQELGRGAGSSGAGSSGFSTNGSITNDNNFQMNGIQVNDLQGSQYFSGGIPVPNPDALEEFKVVTSQYDASYGRNAGAQVNVVTKSGGNKFHGSVFEFLRNDALNANEWFNKRDGNERGVLKQNQFGGTIGGAIVKDKLFYFGSYQGTRQRNGITGGCSSTLLLPPLTNDRSAAALGALFAGKNGYINYYYLGGAGVTISADGSNINPVALKILQAKSPTGNGYLVPTPQVIDAEAAASYDTFDSAGRLTISQACPFSEDQFIANLDYQQTAKMKWAVRSFVANSSASIAFPDGSVPGYPAKRPSDFRNLSLQNTYVFSPTLLNQFDFGFNNTHAGNVSTRPFKFSDFGITAPDFDNTNPRITFANIALGGKQQTLEFLQKSFTVQDTLTLVHGKHNMRFGGSVIRTHSDEDGLDYPGTVQFVTFSDLLLGLDAVANGSADFGLPVSNVYQTIDLPGDKARQYRSWQNSIFFQDDFKVASRFTLNVGLRWEWVGNLSDAGGRNTTFDLDRAEATPPAAGTLAGYLVASNFKGDIPAGVGRASTESGIRGIGQSTWNPRVGFAWQLPGTDRFVLRGGYGVFRSRSTGQPLNQSIAAPPFAVARQLTATDNAAATFENPFPSTMPTLPSFVSYSPTTRITAYNGFSQDFQPAMYQRYSLDLQSQLGRDYVLDVGYIGSRGTHVAEQLLPNQAALASATNPIRGVTTNTVNNARLRVPIQGIAIPGLVLIDSNAFSWYNGLSTTFAKRMSHGLQFQTSYTFSRALSSAPGTIANGNGAGVVYGNQLDPRSHYGADAFNREHRLVISYVYELPRPGSANSWVGRVFGGWSVAGVTVAQSGHRLTSIYSNSANAYGVSYDHPNYDAGCAVNKSGSVQDRISQYYNKSCYSAPTVIGADNRATEFGNGPIGNILGPGQFNTDLALVKRIGLKIPRENSVLEFRTEFFNAFNHAQFSDPDTLFNSSTEGQITSTSVGPRIMQFALKLTF